MNQDVMENVSAPAGNTFRKKILWTGMFLLIAALSIWAVCSQIQHDSLADLGRQLKQMHPVWAAAAVLSMLCFILFEGCSIQAACRALGIHPRFYRCCQYAAADIYFSAITPSATGGQPASVLMMHQDGISLAAGTAALLINLAMCAFATFGVGLICFLFHFRIFLQFGLLARILIAVGFVMQLVTALFLYLTVWHETMLQHILAGLIRIGARMHLIRHREAAMKMLQTKMEEYRQSVGLIAHRRHELILTFLFNFLQRCAQICVTVFVFFAMNLRGASGFDIWSMQGYVIMGSNYVPIPGGMGVADLLLLDAFGSILSENTAAQLELVSRSLSFYLCILLCGGLLAVRLIVRRIRSSHR